MTAAELEHHRRKQHMPNSKLETWGHVRITRTEKTFRPGENMEGVARKINILPEIPWRTYLRKNGRKKTCTLAWDRSAGELF